MPIRVLDPDGRVCKPMRRGQAVREVDRKRAEWLCAAGVEPNKEHGTIILTRPVREPSPERVMTQIYNGDGELLGWLWPDVAELWVRKGAISQVGTSSEDGPRAAILPRVVDPKAMAAIRRIEGWRIAEGLRVRAELRLEIQRLMKHLKGDALEDAIVEKVRLYLGRGADLALEELRGIRRRITAMEFALAPDMTAVRHELIER